MTAPVIGRSGGISAVVEPSTVDVPEQIVLRPDAGVAAFGHIGLARSCGLSVTEESAFPAQQPASQACSLRGCPVRLPAAPQRDGSDFPPIAERPHHAV